MLYCYVLLLFFSHGNFLMAQPEQQAADLRTPAVTYGGESWTLKKAEHQILLLSNCGAGEDSWMSLGKQGDQASQS